MTTMRLRLVVWTALTLLAFVGSASAVYLVSPSALLEVTELVDCHGRSILVGELPATCAAPRGVSLARDEAPPFDTASAMSLQAQGRSFAEAFGPAH